jgi:hypothetical protein
VLAHKYASPLELILLHSDLNADTNIRESRSKKINTNLEKGEKPKT